MKKWIWFVLFCAVCASTLPVIRKALPIVADKECYRSFFPRGRFLAKLSQPIPEWMVKQLHSDLKDCQEGIELYAIDQTFRTIEESSKVPFYRYRIIDNKLYSYKARSGTDNAFEKALKTLLLYAQIPNVDFIYCPMDGLPEPYMRRDFYLTGDPHTQAPVFAKAKLLSAPYAILIPDQFSLSKEWFDVANEILALNQEIRWDQKKEAALWRGGFTDIGLPQGGFVPHFRDCPRFKISKLSSKSPEWVDAGLGWSDCAELDALLQLEQTMKPGASKREHLLCKYLPVLDGHMCTYPGYQWRLLSNSVSFKQDSEQVQWFYSALKPYVHFVPVKNDMSDLMDRIEWAKMHEKQVLQIVENAREFAENHLMIEDDYVYLAEALKQYAKIQKINWSQIKRKMGKDWTCIQYRKRQSLAKSWRHLKRSAYLGSRNSKCAGDVQGVLSSK
jgi:hypothetical protein